MAILPSKYYLTEDVGRLKKGIYSEEEINKYFRAGSNPPIIPLSWALREGMVRADVSEADHINDLTFYTPEEMEAIKSGKKSGKKKFLINKLGEIIRAGEANEPDKR